MVKQSVCAVYILVSTSKNKLGLTMKKRKRKPKRRKKDTCSENYTVLQNTEF